LDGFLAFTPTIATSPEMASSCPINGNDFIMKLAPPSRSPRAITPRTHRLRR
jgi:hypothetical protein